MKLDRRELLRKAGLTSMALASVPTLATVMAKPVEAAGRTSFDFVVVSKRVGQSDQIIFNGNGVFNHSEVDGAGAFTWFIPPGGPIVAFGTWKARNVLKFSAGGTFGADQGGILDLAIHLRQRSPHTAVIPATVRVVCTLATDTGGLPEGVTLSLPNGIRFEPIDVGITIFTIATGRDRDNA